MKDAKGHGNGSAPRASASFIDRVTPAIDATIKALAACPFTLDPIVSAEQSRAASLVESAYKRHGNILEAALREAVADCDRFVVWHEPHFIVSKAADHTSTASTEEGCRQTEMPYGDGETNRILQIDALVYEKRSKVLRSYEIKRGHGHLDAGKTRQTEHDLLCTQMLLRTYGEQRDLQVSKAEALICFYYGVKSLTPCLIREDLDTHFGVPVVAKIEQANALFRQRLADLLAQSVKQ